MAKVRIIPRLDIKGPNLVKGIHLEGLRIIGDPQEYATKYYEEGADEILYVDIVASLYGRNNLVEIVKRTARNISIPLIVGGGVRTIDDIRTLLRAGADKVSINTAAVENHDLISKAVRIFGSQCIVIAVDIKRWPDASFLSKINETVSRTSVSNPQDWDKSFFQVYIENGRQQTGLDALQWIIKVVELGAGEVMITSIDKEGTLIGYETDFIRKVSDLVCVPIIAGGGAGCEKHIVDVIKTSAADAVTIASILHYNKTSIRKIKSYLSMHEIDVANYSEITKYD